MKKKLIFKSNFSSLISHLSSPKGFTLIEMIVVIGIIAAIAGVVLAVVDPMTQFQKANDGRRKSDLAQIQKALEQYYQDKGRYPTHSTSSPLYRIKKFDGVTTDWGQAFTPYINVLPKDPNGSKNYVYYSPTGGQSYYLYASLDRDGLGRSGKDPNLCNNDGSRCTSVPVGASCGGTCNYGVSSPNVSP